MGNKSTGMNEFPLLDTGEGNIVLCHPHIPKNGIKYVTDTLGTRWLGQGPKVDLFEKIFSEKFCSNNPAVAVGSGTDALHLSYLLADINSQDEVIVPVFTCTATNIPLLYIGAKIVFADVDPATLNINVDHVERLITENTKAIVCVHYGGLPCDMKRIHGLASKYGIKVIEDAAHSIGAVSQGVPIGSVSDFTMFSFQAIKHITTGEGGMLTFRDADLYEKAKRLRWFGIDRSQQHLGIWENDIKEVGYKYQMTDIGAALGLAAMEEVDEIVAYRKSLFARYIDKLGSNKDITIVGKDVPQGDEHAAWLFTVLVEDRVGLQKKLREAKIESAQMHYRNDRYSIFGGRRPDLVNMDSIEEKYLVLPLHTKMNLDDVERIAEVIHSGW
jgi:dTDP-4-amino-4,6-dideoxygalactose transaminase